MHKKKLFTKGISMALIASQAMSSMTALAGVWEVKDGNWMYKGDDGTHLKNTWFRDPADNRLYYLDENGVMKSGWMLKDGIWYFLTNVHNGYFGSAVENGWAWVDGYCYYFGPDGKMAASCVTPDGFHVNHLGQWTENGTAVYVDGRGYQTKPAAVSDQQANEKKKTNSSGSSYSGSWKDKENDRVNAVYSYIVRYCDENGDILDSYEGTGYKNSFVNVKDKAFDGYKLNDGSKLTFKLTMDEAVFKVNYTSVSSGIEPETMLQYTVRYVDENGKILNEYKESTAKNSEIMIPEKGIEGYLEDQGQTHIRTVTKSGDIFFIRYTKIKRSVAASYHLQHVGPQNEILETESFQGTLGDSITLQANTYNGYKLLENQNTEVLLSLDGQVFSLYYESETKEENIVTGPKENNDICNYTVYYVGTDDEVLHSFEGTGKEGDVLTIETRTFEGYKEASDQEHTVTLSAGTKSFMILYNTDREAVLNYTIRYAGMDGTILEETNGTDERGTEISIPKKTFEGYKEIENQKHLRTLDAEGNILSIKYEKIRELDDEEFIRVEKPSLDKEKEDPKDKLESSLKPSIQDKIKFNVSFVDENEKQIGNSMGYALRGSTIPVPSITLAGYEVNDDNPEELVIEGQNAMFSIACTSLMPEDEIPEATESVPSAQTVTYYYLITYYDKDTGEVLASESGLAEDGQRLSPQNVPEGYTLAEDYSFEVVASENVRTNYFKAWCVNNESIVPEGSVEYTITCVDPDGNVIKTFTDIVKSGTVITPSYEIYGYDMDTEGDYTFTVTEDNFSFEVLYIPYKINDFEFRITDIDTGEVIDKRSMEGRAGAIVDVELTEEDFFIEGYELLSSIPETVRISSNASNNFMNIYVQENPEITEVVSMRPYVIHFVAEHDNTIKLFDDVVGTAKVGSVVTAHFAKEVDRVDGHYEVIAQGESKNFTIEEFVEVNEFYIYYYRTEEFAQEEKKEVPYSIRFVADDTTSVLGVMTGSAYPGEKVFFRNTFRNYAFNTDSENFFIVTSDEDSNYISVPVYRITGIAPEMNEHTGKYDGAEWLLTFTDENGNLLLPWRTGYTRKGDVFYADYPNEIITEDGTVYRALTKTPYAEYMNGTTYRQYNIKYKKGNASGSLLEKWEEKAQACLDEIKGTVPYTYTVTYKEKDSWNDIGIYVGLGTKNDEVKFQGINIPGYNMPENVTESTFVLDEDKKNVTFNYEAFDGEQKTNWFKDDYQIRFTDGNGNDILEPVSGQMAFETKNSYSYMTVHYPATFRDKNGDIWEADEKGPKQLTMWNLSDNQFEITYHRYYENQYENFYAEDAEDAKRILREMAVFTVDADTHEYLVIGKDYNATMVEVGSVISKYDIKNYTTELVDEFESDGVTYYVTRISFAKRWNADTCTHQMTLTHEVQANCEVSGKRVYTCSKCGYEEITHFQAAGHVDEDIDGKCDNCNTQMALNIGDEITITWNPGALDKESFTMDFICIDTDYKGTGKKLMLCIDNVPAEYYGSYSYDGHADYHSSDLRSFLEGEFLDGLSNKDVLQTVEDRKVSILTKDEYDTYKAQAANNYKFPSGITVLYEEDGEDGKVALSNGTSVTPDEAANYYVRPVIYLEDSDVTEGIESGRWKVGDIQSRQIGDQSYLFRCVNDNFKDNSNLDKSMALFVCDTVLPSYVGMEFNDSNTRRETRFFGSNNNYRYSEIHKFLNENKKETGSLVTMDIGIVNEYEGSTKSGAFQTLDQRDLTKHKRSTPQYFESKLFIPSVEEALDMKDYLWKFNRSEKNNVGDIYDGQYLTSYWLRTPVYGTTDMVYVVNLADGTIEPHSVSEEYAITGTTASMEFSADNGNTWSACAPENTVVSGPGTYLVRNRFEGAEVTPVLSGGDYVIMNTNSLMEYSVDGGNTWNTCADGETSVGVGTSCLLRSKGYSYEEIVNNKVYVLNGTKTTMEYSTDGGSTWNTCGTRFTEVTSNGTYLVREKSNPAGAYEIVAEEWFKIPGTAYGMEYSKDGVNWQLCTEGNTYVRESGDYIIRHTNVGKDYTAVKKTCSVGIRPVYVVYQN